MNHRFRLGCCLLVLGLGAACGTTRMERASAPATVVTAAHREAEARGDLAPSPSPTGKRFAKWNPIWWLGNVDDPEPPAWYRPGSASRGWLWQLRNPLHNFTFYVIGIADKPFTRDGKFPNDVFARDGGWNWAVAKHQWARLPFISFNGERGRFYLGWRERGNFGAKINLGRRPTPAPSPQPAAPTTK